MSQHWILFQTLLHLHTNTSQARCHRLLQIILPPKRYQTECLSITTKIYSDDILINKLPLHLGTYCPWSIVSSNIQINFKYSNFKYSILPVLRMVLLYCAPLLYFSGMISGYKMTVCHFIMTVCHESCVPQNTASGYWSFS